MNFEWFWSYLLAILSSSAITAVALLWIFIKNPEKIEKWISMITRGFAWTSDKVARTHMATNIQSAIAEKRNRLGLTERGLSYGVKIKWTGANTILTDLHENKVVVMMRPYQSQSKNFAHVVSIYVPKALLPKSRRYVDPKLMKSIDCTVSKSILDVNPTAMEYYLDEILGDVPGEIKSWMTKMDAINEQGNLSRIIIPELERLSALYPREPDSQVYTETSELAEATYQFVAASDESRGIGGLGIYAGNNIKMAIIPVGKPEKLLTGGIQPHFGFIQEQLANGIDHFYIVSTDVNIEFAKMLVEKACSESQFAKVFTEEHTGKFRGKRTKMFCSLVSFYHK